MNKFKSLVLLGFLCVGSQVGFSADNSGGEVMFLPEDVRGKYTVSVSDFDETASEIDVIFGELQKAGLTPAEFFSNGFNKVETLKKYLAGPSPLSRENFELAAMLIVKIKGALKIEATRVGNIMIGEIRTEINALEVAMNEMENIDSGVKSLFVSHRDLLRCFQIELDKSDLIEPSVLKALKERLREIRITLTDLSGEAAIREIRIIDEHLSVLQKGKIITRNTFFILCGFIRDIRVRLEFKHSANYVCNTTLEEINKARKGGIREAIEVIIRHFHEAGLQF